MCSSDLSSYYDSTEYSSSDDDDDDEEDEMEDEDEELCSSYCSSDEEELVECPESSSQAFVRPPLSTESDDIRMKRILAWRENFSAAMSATFSGKLPPCCVFNNNFNWIFLTDTTANAATTTAATTIATATATSLKRKFPGDYRGADHDETASPARSHKAKNVESNQRLYH